MGRQTDREGPGGERGEREREKATAEERESFMEDNQKWGKKKSLGCDMSAKMSSLYMKCPRYN